MSEADSIEVTCPRCQKQLRVPRDQVGKRVRCSNPSCAVLIDVSAPSVIGSSSEAATARYPILRLVANLYLVLASLSLLCALGGVIFGLARAFRPEPSWTDLTLAGSVTVGGLIGAVSFLAFAELVRLVLAIESHTRAIRIFLTKSRDQSL